MRHARARGGNLGSSHARPPPHNRFLRATQIRSAALGRRCSQMLLPGLALRLPGTVCGCGDGIFNTRTPSVFSMRLRFLRSRFARRASEAAYRRRWSSMRMSSGVPDPSCLLASPFPECLAVPGWRGRLSWARRGTVSLCGCGMTISHPDAKTNVLSRCEARCAPLAKSPIFAC